MEPEALGGAGDGAAARRQGFEDDLPLEALSASWYPVATAAAAPAAGDPVSSSVSGRSSGRMTSPPRTTARSMAFSARGRCPASRSARAARRAPRGETRPAVPRGCAAVQRARSGRPAAGCPRGARAAAAASMATTFEPVVEVLAEAPAVDLACSQVAVGRRDEPDVDRDRAASPPTRSNVRSWSTRRSLACERERHLADLVEEQRAAVGRPRSVPARAATAPVNAPFSWPNSSLSSSVSGERGAVDARRTARRARGWRSWSARATSSLPVPLSPRMSTVAWVGATLLDQLADAAHAGALTDQAGADLGGLEAPVLPLELPVAQRGGERARGEHAGRGQHLELLLVEGRLGPPGV